MKKYLMLAVLASGCTGLSKTPEQIAKDECLNIDNKLEDSMCQFLVWACLKSYEVSPESVRDNQDCQNLIKKYK